MIKKLLSAAVLSMLLATNGQAQSVDKTTERQIVKVDFDFSGRRTEEVSDPNYSSWPISEQTEAEKTFNNVTFKLKGNFSSKWYKVGMSAPFYSRLASDGLVTDKSLEFTISGLKEGQHSLLTFHNTFDKVEGKTFAPVKIFVNDKLAETVTPSNRANATIDAATSYIVFNAQAGKDVVIRFELDSKSADLIQQLVINGFEIDTPNLKKQSHSPKPENANEHVVVDKSLILNWESSKDAVAHNLYFGTNKNAITNATVKSAEFKGKQTKTKFTVADLYSMTTYYWRVDEIDNKGNITLGEVWSFKPAQLAFPGAEGYGRFAVGGRGGRIVEVDNLNDSGPGSFRAAVNDGSGPKTIVFNVSGNIKLEDRLVVNNPYITIAGQTAPGEGITISKAPVGLTGNDGVIRFLKVRIGSGKTYDGMGLTGANHSIIDHCSISWTIDESFSSRGAHNITLQRTLISEALNVAGHDKYEVGKMHGFAATIGGDIGSFHHNLLAHNYGRNWSIGGGLNGDGYYTGRLDIRNNVVYNWGQRTTDGGANEVNFVNNYYKPGASTKYFYALNAQHEGVGKGKQQYYFRGNIMEGYFDEKNQEKGRTATISHNEIVKYETFVDKPFFESFVKTESAKAAYKNVLSDVGASEPFFDKHDNRIIGETLKGTFTFKGSKSGLGGMIDSDKDLGDSSEYASEKRSSDWDTDHDGLPNWWEVAHNLNENSKAGDFSDTNSDIDKDGYTQLDEYLDWMSKPHYFINAGEKKELSAIDYFKGYENKPVYSFSEVKNGKVTVKGNTIEFNTTGKGLASFVITVKDADGDSMSRKINFFVK
ncbi:T9SS C-terminal target domain-containing protein [Flavobacterium sp. ANB]|uniref:pectate lyase family protein n=1 Tax=unclassified Flavobacterium TaxID=196869 RepID=UPI0012B9AF19|nr:MULTISPECIES: T9SS C-terminal target domain-containing protein [unclassified Flavobacterium]MBF4517807.1 T9SS C-terminal target domain-containing protein [Flavobacterium sp. ANB]MTD70534.1 T9SS C-terminal target domain-containing protein [Flavobacterium sp. LC2016-13]